MESLITTEIENAILQMDYDPTEEWGGPPTPTPQPIAVSVRELSVRVRVLAARLQEEELNTRASDHIIDVLQQVSREFIRIDLGV